MSDPQSKIVDQKSDSTSQKGFTSIDPQQSKVDTQKNDEFKQKSMEKPENIMSLDLESNKSASKSESNNSTN